MGRPPCDTALCHTHAAHSIQPPCRTELAAHSPAQPIHTPPSPCMQKGCPTGPSCHLSRVCLQAFNPTTDMHSDVRCPDQVAVAGHASPAGLGGSMHACTAGLTLSRLQPLPATQSKAGPWACVHTPRTRAARYGGPGTEKSSPQCPPRSGQPPHISHSPGTESCAHGGAEKHRRGCRTARRVLASPVCKGSTQMLFCVNLLERLHRCPALVF